MLILLWWEVKCEPNWKLHNDIVISIQLSLTFVIDNCHQPCMCSTVHTIAYIWFLSLLLSTTKFTWRPNMNDTHTHSKLYQFRSIRLTCDIYLPWSFSMSSSECLWSRLNAESWVFRSTFSCLIEPISSWVCTSWAFRDST